MMSCSLHGIAVGRCAECDTLTALQNESVDKVMQAMADQQNRAFKTLLASGVSRERMSLFSEIDAGVHSCVGVMVDGKRAATTKLTLTTKSNVPGTFVNVTTTFHAPYEHLGKQ